MVVIVVVKPSEGHVLDGQEKARSRGSRRDKGACELPVQPKKTRRKIRGRLEHGVSLTKSRIGIKIEVQRQNPVPPKAPPKQATFPSHFLVRHHHTNILQAEKTVATRFLSPLQTLGPGMG